MEIDLSRGVGAKATITAQMQIEFFERVGVKTTTAAQMHCSSCIHHGQGLGVSRRAVSAYYNLSPILIKSGNLPYDSSGSSTYSRELKRITGPKLYAARTPSIFDQLVPNSLRQRRLVGCVCFERFIKSHLLFIQYLVIEGRGGVRTFEASTVTVTQIDTWCSAIARSCFHQTATPSS
jgi:hypothetical protein